MEACITSVRAGVAAWRAGADRLELCARLRTGGLTPRATTVAAVRAAIPIPVHVMIRPRAGDFVYTAADVATMRRHIRRARADGVVFGALTAGRTVDHDAMTQLIPAARPAAVTFHRAFDAVRDPFSALDDLIALGVDYVLTSGGAPTARAGATMLRRLVRRAGDRIGIIAAGTIRHGHVRDLVAATGVTAVHAHTDARGTRLLAQALRSG